MLPTAKISLSKANQSKRDMKMLEEITEETAKISSSLFNDTVWLNRAYLLLKGPNMPQTEGHFKSLVLVLNGRIKQLFKLSLDVRTVNTAKIFSHILELDALISEGRKLPRTPSLDHFLLYATVILFRSTGDTLLLLHNMEKGNNTMYEQLAYASYLLAYDNLNKASPISPILAAIFVLEMLILRTLLRHFSNIKIPKNISHRVGELLYKACNGLSPLRSKSFMVSVISLPCNSELRTVEQNEFARLVVLADKSDFMISLLWLLAYNEDLRNRASFLDPFVRNIPVGNFDGDLQSFTVSSLSKLDAKVLLLSAAEWSKISTSCWQKNDALKMGILPPLAFVQPSYMVINFWNLLVSYANKEAREQCSENRLIISAMEVTRLRGEIPDARIVDNVRKWLIANGNALGDTNGNWATLYSRAFMDLMNGAHYLNQGISTEDLFFPPLNDSEYDMLDDVEKWFPPTNITVSEYSVPENHVENDSGLNGNSDLKQTNVLSDEKMESTSNISHQPKGFLQRISSSAKRTLYNESRKIVSFPCAPKSENIRALKALNKDYEMRRKNETLTSPKSNTFSTAMKENKTGENIYEEIVKMQNDHAWTVCRLLQWANSLQERMKQCAVQYSTDLAIYASKAYRQGYGDGFYAALQAASNFTVPVGSDNPPTVRSTTQNLSSGFSFGSHPQKSSSESEHPHNPKECIGCASEKEQEQILRILDCMADRG